MVLFLKQYIYKCNILHLVLYLQAAIVFILHTAFLVFIANSATLTHF